MLSSCLGEPLRRFASTWWYYMQETAKAERKQYRRNFPNDQQFEMEVRRRGM
jgi:hypothetical protein